MKRTFFAKKLNELLAKEKNITNFAKKCGIPRSTLNSYLKGDSEPDVTKLLKIVNSTGVDIRDLVGLPIEEKPKVAATIEPGSDEKKRALQVQNRKGNIINLTPAQNELFDDIQGWLEMRSKDRSANQYEWLRGQLEDYEDFREYTKKRQGSDYKNSAQS